MTGGGEMPDVVAEKLMSFLCKPSLAISAALTISHYRY